MTDGVTEVRSVIATLLSEVTGWPASALFAVAVVVFRGLLLG